MLKIAATEGYVDTGAKDEYGNRIYEIFLGGPLNQSYGRMVTGGKYEAIMNVGINVNDNLYFGLNFGATTMNYNYDEYFKEAAKDPSTRRWSTAYSPAQKDSSKR